MASLVFQVQSMSSAGADRVSVQFVQVNPDQGFGSNVGLNLTQAEAAEFEVNQQYTMSLTKAAPQE